VSRRRHDERDRGGKIEQSDRECSKDAQGEQEKRERPRHRAETPDNREESEDGDDNRDGKKTEDPRPVFGDERRTRVHITATRAGRHSRVETGPDDEPDACHRGENDRGVGRETAAHHPRPRLDAVTRSDHPRRLLRRSRPLIFARRRSELGGRTTRTRPSHEPHNLVQREEEDPDDHVRRDERAGTRRRSATAGAGCARAEGDRP
jgi:hypothetical protein